jgi:hypothetical protein
MATHMRVRTSRSRAALGAIALAMVVLPSGGCTPDWAENNDSNVILRIVKITGSTGGDSAGSGVDDVLNSDVFPVFNDNATLELQVIPKNQSADLNLGQLNDVLLESYEVRYLRTDGLDREGADVPYRITGPLATQVEANQIVQASIVVVRHQAKEEPPLRNLRFLIGTGAGGGEDIVSIIARITVFGRTTSGKAVTATGSLQINFADFADE